MNKSGARCRGWSRTGGGQRPPWVLHGRAAGTAGTLPWGSALQVGLYVLGWAEMPGGQLGREMTLLQDLSVNRHTGENSACPPSIGLRHQTSWSLCRCRAWLGCNSCPLQTPGQWLEPGQIRSPPGSIVVVGAGWEGVCGKWSCPSTELSRNPARGCYSNMKLAEFTPVGLVNGISQRRHLAALLSACTALLEGQQWARLQRVQQHGGDGASSPVSPLSPGPQD